MGFYNESAFARDGTDTLLLSRGSAGSFITCCNFETNGAFCLYPRNYPRTINYVVASWMLEITLITLGTCRETRVAILARPRVAELISVFKWGLENCIRFWVSLHPSYIPIYTRRVGLKRCGGEECINLYCRAIFVCFLPRESHQCASRCTFSAKFAFNVVRL